MIVMTAYGSVSAAVDAMKRGAADYLSKPFEPEQLSAAVDRVLRHRAADRPSDQTSTAYPDEIITSESSPMQEVLRCARKVAPTDATVLILGESGTGKELLARAVHEQSRRKGVFVPIDCAAIPEALLESELFGYDEAASTGANNQRDGLIPAADGGRCSWTRSASCPMPCRPDCFAFFNSARCAAWVQAKPRRSTSG